MGKRKGKILFRVLAIAAVSVMLIACGNEEVELKKVRGAYMPSDFTQADVESDTIQWMCSAYAIYSEYNSKSLVTVGGLEEEDRKWYQENIKTALSEGWGISGRKDVYPTVKRLVQKGHKKEYRQVIKRMERKGLLSLPVEDAMAKLSEDENLPRYQTAYEAYQKYGEYGIDGWDYCRALQILGDCYQAEYINLEECLDLSLPIAQRLQSIYGDWAGVAESYLYGYSFWQKELPEDYDSQTRWDIYEELKEMPDGPYQTAYDTKLENTWRK